MSGPLNPFDSHKIPGDSHNIPGEIVLEGKTNAPTQFIPSSFPDLSSTIPASLPPATTMPSHAFPPTAMHPQMQTRQFGASPPGSFVGAPPPSMPYAPYAMDGMRPGSFKAQAHDTSNVFNSMNDFSPGSFQVPGSGFPPQMSMAQQMPSQTNLQNHPGMVHNMSWAPQRPNHMGTTNSSGFWNSQPFSGSRKHDPNRFDRAARTNKTLEDQLNGMTGDHWKQHHAKQFSALTKASLDDVDWRVPRVNYCLDSKYNDELPVNLRKAVGQAKAKDGAILEHHLGADAIRKWKEEHPHPDTPMPPMETVIKPGSPFLAVHPGYRRWDDMWEREFTLRNLGEAMKGDLNTPMPRPVLFGEDYQNFHQGKYLKDECPIA